MSNPIDLTSSKIIEISRSKPDTNKITYEEEKVALILGTTAVFTVLWMFK